MAKSAHSDVLDNGAAYIKANCNKMTLCALEPATYLEATAGVKFLAQTAMAGTDFTLAADTTGRKLTVGAKAGASVAASGSADHVAFVDTVAGKLLYVTTATAQAVTIGNTVNFAAVDIMKIGQPV